jgi:predicted dehydrogenase
MAADWFPASKTPPLRGGPVLRWGVLGPGTIANDFTAAIHRHTEQRVVAVASRSAARAARFAAAHAVDRAYAGYEELLADPDIDIVYIATPHSEHHRLALMTLAAGKHALIEKPIALSAGQAREIAHAAAGADRLAAEAMWTRYLPQFDVLRQVLDRGDLGEVRLATADVGWQASADAPPRSIPRAQGGGVALDMGVYGYWFAHFAIGPAVEVRALGSVTDTGVDDQSAVALRTADGRQASVTTSMAVTNSGLATACGTDGRAQFLEPFVFPAAFAVHIGADVHEWRDTSALKLRDGLAWQAAALARYIGDGQRDSPVHRLQDAVDVLGVIDEVRRQIVSPPAPDRVTPTTETETSP